MSDIPWKDIVEIITAISLILSLLGGIIVWATSVWNKLSKLTKILVEIQQEFSPNGGGSLRDSINLIAVNQSKILSTTHVLYSYLNRACDTPIIVIDRSGRCTWANKAYLELTNRQLTEVLGSNWETTVLLDDRDYVREEWYNACEDGRSFEVNYRLSNKPTGENMVKCIVYGDVHTGYIGFLEKISLNP